MSQIRLNKTPEIEEVLAFLQRKYRLLSEAEIIKVALAEKFNKEIQASNDQDIQARQAWEALKVEGKKLGDKLMAKKGLKRKNVSEEQFYNIFLSSHKHNAENHP